MKALAYSAIIILFGVVAISAAARHKARKASPAVPGLAQLQKMTARFAPTPLRVDTSELSSGTGKPWSS